MDWVRLIETVGVCATLVIYYTIQSWWREKRLSTRVTALEEFVQKELIELVKKGTEALNHSAEALSETIAACNELGKSLKELTDELKKRPCQK